MWLQSPPLNALEWTLTGLLILYLLTFVDEFRDVTVNAEVKVKDRRISADEMTMHRHQGPGGGQNSFTASPQGPMCQQYSMHSPGVRSVGGVQSTGRYIYAPQGGLIWVPSKGP